jgi:hypothetical protein
MARRISMATRTELIEAIIQRYQSSRRTAKQQILDEFVAVTGYHRKHAIRVLRYRETKPPPTRQASRQVMKQGAHANVMTSLYDGTVAKHGFTSVWTKHRINPLVVRCETCGKTTRGPGEDRLCLCGEKLPEPAPFW